jgi:hypothetical protein
MAVAEQADDRRRVQRAPDDPLVQMNVQIPKSLKGWLTLYAAEQNQSADERVTISSVMRELVEGLRTDVEASHGSA